MCQLFETLRIEEGQVLNANYHLERMNRSRLELGISGQQFTNLAPFRLDNYLAKGLTYRCRIDYSTVIQAITFSKHIYSPIKKLKVVRTSQLNYAHKFADRSQLNFYRNQWPAFDDILLVVNGRITDTSIGNIVFWDGINFVTPKSPLLLGTQRKYLLDKKLVYEEDLLINDLQRFTSWSVINALRPLQFNEFNPISQVYI